MTLVRVVSHTRQTAQAEFSAFILPQSPNSDATFGDIEFTAPYRHSNL